MYDVYLFLGLVFQIIARSILDFSVFTVHILLQFATSEQKQGSDAERRV